MHGRVSEDSGAALLESPYGHSRYYLDNASILYSAAKLKLRAKSSMERLLLYGMTVKVYM